MYADELAEQENVFMAAIEQTAHSSVKQGLRPRCHNTCNVQLRIQALLTAAGQMCANQAARHFLSFYTFGSRLVTESHRPAGILG